MSEDHVYLSVGLSTRRLASFARIIAGSLIAALLLLLFLVASSSDTAYATSFDPEGSACLDDFDTIDPFPAGPHANDCDGDSTPGVSSDITTSFILPKGNSNFGGTIGFVPAGLSPPSDAEVPNGAIVSQLLSIATLGLLDGPCSTGTLVMFVMIDATTDTSDIIKPAPKGDQLEPIAVDADGNGIPDGADHYPIYLNLVLDPDFDNIGPDALPGTADDVNGPLQPPQPRSRQFGVAKVAGITVILNFLLFDPGTPLGDFVTVDPALGFPSVTVLQDPTVPLSQPTANTITDFCSPLTVRTTTFGLTRDNGCTPKPAASEFRCNSDDARYTGACLIGIAALDGGCGSVSGTTNPDESDTAYRTNPSSASTLNFVASASSQLDADNDGIENILDSCALTADPSDTDPRSLSNPQDPDQDGLWNSCDPNPNAPSPNVQTTRPVNPCESQGGKDEDEDCFNNRADNCPLVPNGVAFNGTVLGPNSQTDSDSDGIGDACDPDPNTDNGHLHVACGISQVDIGGGGSAPVEEDYLCSEVSVCLDVNRNGSCDFLEAGGTPNQAPTCAGVEVIAFEGTITPSFSLNCSDPDGDALTCSIVTQGSKGELSISSCESATYTPNPDETGADTVTYKANDGTDDSDTATVSVTILGDTDGDDVPDIDDQCPGTASGDSVDASGCSEAQLEELEEETKEELIEEAQAGQTSLSSVLTTVIAGGSTNVLALCADENDDPLPGVDITFKVDQQPGSDADLDGQAEVTNTTDAEGIAIAKLNVGSTAGDIVVSATAAECDTATITVTVKEATQAGGGGDDDGGGGDDDDTAVLGGAGGPDTGVGSLAPAIASIPTWAAIASGLGLTGLVGSLGTFVAHILRRRR